MTLEARLDRLERQSIFWRRTALALAAGVIGWAAWTATHLPTAAADGAPVMRQPMRSQFVELPDGYIIDLDKVSLVSHEHGTTMVIMNGISEPGVTLKGEDADALWLRMQSYSTSWVAPPQPVKPQPQQGGQGQPPQSR